MNAVGSAMLAEETSYLLHSFLRLVPSTEVGWMPLEREGRYEIFDSSVGRLVIQYGN